MLRFRVIPCLLVIGLWLYSLPGMADDTGLMRLATTSSVQNTGLLEQMIRRFELESGYQVKLYVVGSGAAMRMGRRGLADAIISHSPAAESRFMEEGHGAVRRPLMQNDFVLVGPAGDPAAIRGISDAAVALNRIAVHEQTFVSRADESGTHKREQRLWKTCGLDPFGQPWYREAGMGMGDTLKLGDEMQGYLLVDRGTWLSMRSLLKLDLLSSGDPRLLNAYSVMAVSDDPHHEVNEKAGRAFVDWMTSGTVQKQIADFRVGGEYLFTPAHDLRQDR